MTDNQSTTSRIFNPEGLTLQQKIEDLRMLVGSPDDEILEILEEEGYEIEEIKKYL